MNIITIRFENRIHYSVEIPTETRAIQIPRFILQPLVENAVYHGLEPKYGDGHLRIYCTEPSDNDILLCIEDDGIGISEEELSKLTEQLKQLNSDKLLHLNTDNSLALFNINQRIQQSFGIECGLKIESFPGKGTCIKIRLPQNHS